VLSNGDVVGYYQHEKRTMYLSRPAP
jgi:hypothetical protein